MGYTHYWRQKGDVPGEAWDDLTAGAENIFALCEANGVGLAWDYDEPAKPTTANARGVRFNGVGDAGHETFIISRQQAPFDAWERDRSEGKFDCCKTAAKPYDIAVTAILCYVDSILGDVFTVSSDGDYHDWVAGLRLAQQAWPAKANQLDIPRAVIEKSRWARTICTSPTFRIAQDYADQVWIERNYANDLSDLHKFDTVSRFRLPFTLEAMQERMAAAQGAERIYGHMTSEKEYVARAEAFCLKVWNEYKKFCANDDDQEIAPFPKTEEEWSAWEARKRAERFAKMEKSS
jgi:hypothetical protein